MTGAQPMGQVTTSIGWSGHWTAPEPPQQARISGAEAEIDSPVPVLAVREDGSEVALHAGAHKVTVR